MDVAFRKIDERRLDSERAQVSMVLERLYSRGPPEEVLFHVIAPDEEMWNGSESLIWMMRNTRGL